MCRGRIQWWQSRTVSAAPVTGWTSSGGDGSSSFSQWPQCDCPTSGPEKLWCPVVWMTPLQSQCCSWWWVGGERGSLRLYLHLFKFYAVIYIYKKIVRHNLSTCIYFMHIIKMLDQKVLKFMEKHTVSTVICLVLSPYTDVLFTFCSTFLLKLLQHLASRLLIHTGVYPSCSGVETEFIHQSQWLMSLYWLLICCCCSHFLMEMR